MIDTSRILYFLPALGPAQVVHYAQPDDLTFIEWWITYLRDHDRIPSNAHATVIEPSDTEQPAVPRMVVSVRDGHSEQNEHLRLGQSLILHDGQLTALDTDVLHQKFHLLRDPLIDRIPPSDLRTTPVDER